MKRKKENKEERGPKREKNNLDGGKLKTHEKPKKYNM